MNIYDLPLNTKVWDVNKKMIGKVTKVHPPKNYHYRWYTVTLENGKNRRVYTAGFPTCFLVIVKSEGEIWGNRDYFILENDLIIKS